MPGGEYTHVSDPGTPPLPPGTKVVQLIPVGDGGPGPLLPRVTKRKKRKPLLPSDEEVARLPREALFAFVVRCAERVSPITRRMGHDSSTTTYSGARQPLATVARDTAAIMLTSSDPRDLVWIRRDFDRIARLAKVNKWTDDTPVPPDVFGPLWPGRVPKWAREANGPRE
jgi:hypothetical protein